MPRQLHDLYPTPTGLADQMAKVLYDYRPDALTILDPGCGTWHLSNAANHYFPNASIWGIDVEAPENPPYHYIHKDFLDVHVSQKFDATICNPPYFRNGEQNMAERFFHKAWSMTDGPLLFLVRTTFLNSIGRYKRIFSAWGKRPIRIYHLVKRPRFVDNKSEKGIEYVLILWDTRKHVGVTESVWLNW